MNNFSKLLTSKNKEEYCDNISELLNKVKDLTMTMKFSDDKVDNIIARGKVLATLDNCIVTL